MQYLRLTLYAGISVLAIAMWFDFFERTLLSYVQVARTISAAWQVATNYTSVLSVSLQSTDGVSIQIRHIIIIIIIIIEFSVHLQN